jgi:hypothetical protein
MVKRLTQEEWNAQKRRAGRRTIVSAELDGMVIGGITALFAFYSATAALMFSPLWWFVTAPCALVSALMVRDVRTHAARAKNPKNLSYRAYTRKIARLERG